MQCALFIKQKQKQKDNIDICRFYMLPLDYNKWVASDNKVIKNVCTATATCLEEGSRERTQWETKTSEVWSSSAKRMALETTASSICTTK